MAVYGASKAALMEPVKGITTDYAVRSVRINALLPGGIRDGMAGDDAQKGWVAGLYAMKRIVEPEKN